MSEFPVCLMFPQWLLKCFCGLTGSKNYELINFLIKRVQITRGSILPSRAFGPNPTCFVAPNRSSIVLFARLVIYLFMIALIYNFFSVSLRLFSKRIPQAAALRTNAKIYCNFWHWRQQLLHIMCDYVDPTARNCFAQTPNPPSSPKVSQLSRGVRKKRRVREQKTQTHTHT